MRREAGMLRETAAESLTLAIKFFNRPPRIALEHAIVMMLFWD
jgi:hypothetical protein